MMLKGEAKRDWMRAYMREYRRGLRRSGRNINSVLQKAPKTGVETGSSLHFVPQTEMSGPGWVYLIRCSGSSCYKIGIARNPVQRLAELQTGCPYRLQLMRRYFVSDMLRVERGVQERLSSFCVRGEWYELDDEVVALVGRMLSHEEYYWRMLSRLNSQFSGYMSECALFAGE